MLSTPARNCSWAEVIHSRGVVHDGIGLSYFFPLVGVDEVTFIMDDVSEGWAKWKNALIGHVMGSHPSFQSMKQFVDQNGANVEKLM